jgi:lysophospholipase L1-like esterase
MQMFRLAIAALLSASSAALAQGTGDVPPPGRTFDAVNATTIRCLPPPVRSPEQLADQFETRPRDLDELSQRAQAFFNSDSEFGRAFRERQAKQFAEDWAFLCRYRDANADLLASGVRPVAVFMGDSITEGWIEADPAFFAANGYVDRGISGQSSSQMIVRFAHDVVALRPRAVHIMAGTNDIGGATGAITEDEFIGNIRAMLDLARANGIAVVLAAIPPMSRLLPRPEFDTRPVVPRLNLRLKALAEEYTAAWVDYFTPLAASDGSFDARYANDGVHPTRAGYDVMEPLARAAVDRALKGPEK